MNLSQLYYFRKLAELQHYTRSAKELFITQPTLSGSIASLEKELGVSLFQKTGRNVELTKYGAEFLVYVNSALEQLDKGIAIMKGYSGESDGGTIDLGCIITVQTDYIPQLLTMYRKDENNQDEFNITQKPSQILLEGLIQGENDVVFCAKDEAPDDITFVPVVAQEFVVAMNERSYLADKEFIVPEDLKHCALISYREKIPLGKSVKELLDNIGVKGVKYAFDDESILAGFAVNGVDVALMVDTFFLRNVHGMILKPFYNNAEEKKTFCHCVYMAYSNKRYHPYCVDHFIDYVTQHQLDKTDPSKIFFD